MCELVAVTQDGSARYGAPLTPMDLPYGGEILNIDLDGAGLVLQCWHPETDEWSTMLPPVEGMAWKVPPGSKVRAVDATTAPAPAPSMVEQVEAVRA
jgi:hypothetical protein